MFGTLSHLTQKGFHPAPIYYPFCYPCNERGSSHEAKVQGQLPRASSPCPYSTRANLPPFSTGLTRSGCPIRPGAAAVPQDAHPTATTVARLPLGFLSSHKGRIRTIKGNFLVGCPNCIAPDHKGEARGNPSASEGKCCLEPLGTTLCLWEGRALSLPHHGTPHATFSHGRAMGTLLPLALPMACSRGAPKYPCRAPPTFHVPPLPHSGRGKAFPQGNI